MTNYSFDTDDVAEHFEFQFKGHTYRMRFMTTDETKAFAADANAIDKLISLVSPVSEGAPDFAQIMASLNQVAQKRFSEMYAKAVEEA